MSDLTILLIYSVIFLHSSLTPTIANEDIGILEKIKNGLKSMRTYLDTVKDIASLVSNTFKRKSDQKVCHDNDKDNDGSKKPESGTLASAFFRLLGLDSPKVAAITVNSAIFLAQMIGTLFGIRPNAGRSAENEDNNNDETDFNTFKFFMEAKSEKIQELINRAQNPELPNELIAEIDSTDSACIRLLMCKASPIISSIQNSLKNQTTNQRFDLTSWFPYKNEFEDYAESCEKKFPDCRIFPEEIPW